MSVLYSATVTKEKMLAELEYLMKKAGHRVSAASGYQGIGVYVASWESKPGTMGHPAAELRAQRSERGDWWYVSATGDARAVIRN
jgi:hypothetical protein